MPRKVKAKFKCDHLQIFEGSKTAHLRAVTGDTDENKDFTKYTPCGELSINISNDTAASEFFTPGKEYYLEFEEVSN
ncbi:hypothetical protein [Flavobacterium beibuense]|uniref:hypothetical protein n=1 Tax=Flavobacterium beibuense TaxID=657326 RepID=UPI003A95BD67